MQRIRAQLTKRRLAKAGIIGALLAAVFIGGYLVGDDSGEVSLLKKELAASESHVGVMELELAGAKSEAASAEESQKTLKGQLKAERSFNGKSVPSSKENSEVNSEFEWDTAGTVGQLTMKPTALTSSNSGSTTKWTLTVEAKNEGSEPKSPFCGEAGGQLVDSTGRTYTGKDVLGGQSESCGNELQPGLTGTFQGTFVLPSSAKPVAVALYGEYSQEGEAKTWSLPK